jgi:hypothetical protein
MLMLNYFPWQVLLAFTLTLRSSVTCNPPPLSHAGLQLEGSARRPTQLPYSAAHIDGQAFKLKPLVHFSVLQRILFQFVA